ncbi:DUF4843 domain-containing protein [Ancylomarina sp. DW003]|nr:DUF4843 domain-containing protein [Ancylomarina sp. DW003]MDE5422137.1 DUF4843 domain-containing protein [Ancylomarina sp. DW003]
MKNYKILVLISVVYCFFSCQKEQFPLYENNAGVYFDKQKKGELLEKAYSFFQNPNKLADTIFLPVYIVGNTSGVDRVFKAKVVEGKNTNAPVSTYVILEGTVKAGSTVGELPIKVIKKTELESAVYSFELSLVPSDDFPLIDLALSNYKVSLTAMLTKPDNWGDYCSIWFGKKYSDNWLKFIVKTVGNANIGQTMSKSFIQYLNYGLPKEYVISRFPDPVMNAYSLKVRLALRDYNKNSKEPLKHDDGTVVIMP